jgi:peptidoglycan/LPS O-acetylase OafA/YrhL
MLREKTVDERPIATMESEARNQGRTRLVELDGLRGLAATSVLLFHYTYWYDVAVSKRPTLPLSLSGGHFGVELFFIISGFVIFMTLQRTDTVYEFAVSRIARLVPAFWIAVLVSTALIYIFPVPNFEAAGLRRVMANLTMVPAIFHQHPIDPSYWTLSVEFFFYLCMGIILWLRGLKWIEPICFAGLLVCLAARTSTMVPLPERVSMLMSYTQFFVVGICLYRISVSEATGLTYFLLASAISLSLLGSSKASLEAPGFEYFFVTVVLTSVVWFATARRVRILETRLMQFLGKISYPLYLLHQVMGFVILRKFELAGAPPAVAVLFATCCVISAAVVVNVLIERPGQKLLRRTFSRSANPEQVATRRIAGL